MSQIRVEVEIDASLKDVRDVVLNFPLYSEWHTSFMTGISTIPPGKDPYKIVPGDKITVNFPGLTLIPNVISNTPEAFRWKGGTMLGAFAGEHIMEFRESKVEPGGTTFVHGEDYCGWMTWMFGDWRLGIARTGAVQSFAGYAEDVKKRVEALKHRNAT